jgi:hypothetical protein
MNNKHNFSNDVNAKIDSSENEMVNSLRRILAKGLGVGGLSASVAGLSGCVTLSAKSTAGELLDTFTTGLGIGPLSDQSEVNPYTERPPTNELRQKAWALFNAAADGSLRSMTRINSLNRAREAMTKETDRVIANIGSGELKSIDEVLLRVSSKFAESLRLLQDEMVTVAALAPAIRGATIEIPPFSAIQYVQKGYCMDPDKPAPGAGDGLELWNVSQRIPKQLLPLFKALGDWVAKSQENQNQAQRLTWAIMGAGNESGWARTVDDRTVQTFNEIYPDGGKIFADYHNGQIAAKRLFGAAMQQMGLAPYLQNIDLNSTTATNAAANAAMQNLIRQGNTARGDGSPGYSMLDENVAARSVGSASLTAEVTILNGGSTVYRFDRREWFNQPTSKKQGISPTGLVDKVSTVRIASQAAQKTPAELTATQEMWKAIIGDAAKLGSIKVLGWLSEKSFGAEWTLKKLGRSGAAILAAKNVTGAAPVIGNLLAGYEAVTGKDWVTGDALPPIDRMLSILGTVPGANTLKAIAQTARLSGLVKTVSKLPDREIFKLMDDKLITKSLDIGGFIWSGSVDAITKSIAPELVNAPFSTHRNFVQSDIMKNVIIKSAPETWWSATANEYFRAAGVALG